MSNSSSPTAASAAAKRPAPEEEKGGDDNVAATSAAQSSSNPSPDSSTPNKKPKTNKRGPRKKQPAGVKKDGPPPLEIPTNDADWNQGLFELLVFRANHGHCHVPATDPQFFNLLTWTQQQRKQFKNYQTNPATSQLTELQIMVLNSIQFHWHTRGAEHWKLMYDKLVEFQAQHGHTLVQRMSPDPKLGDFVTEQRKQYKRMMEGKSSTMNQERIDLLNQIGFVWQVRQREGWDDRYQQLLEYKEKHGDTLVPQHFKSDKGLGKWVAKQREQYRLLHQGKHSFMTPDRLERLEAIGFVWSLKSGRSSISRNEEPAALGAVADAAAAAAAVDPAVKEEQDGQSIQV